MTEMVVALLMLVNGEIKEARIQTGYSECMKGARVAKRGLNKLKVSNESNSYQNDELTLLTIRSIRYAVV